MSDILKTIQRYVGSCEHEAVAKRGAKRAIRTLKFRHR